MAFTLFAAARYYGYILAPFRDCFATMLRFVYLIFTFATILRQD